MFIRLVVKNFLESKTLTSCLFVLAYWSSGAPRGDIFFPRWRRPLPAAGTQLAWGLYQSLLPVDMNYTASLHLNSCCIEVEKARTGPLGRAGQGVWWWWVVVVVVGDDSCERDM